MTLQELRNLLPSLRIVPPFRIAYGPYALPGSGPFRSCRHPEIVNGYADGLAAAAVALSAVFRNTSLPPEIPVFVFHVSDYAHGGAGMPATLPGPTIVLPNRSDLRSPQERADVARTTAVHEASHAYQYTIRRGDIRIDDWRWFMEATSVFCEEFVFKASIACTDFYRAWLDDPEISLDQASYEAGMFARWLSRRRTPHRPELIGQIWEQSCRLDTPFASIARLEGDVGVLFHEYARDAYFIDDPASPCCLPRLRTWWGLREVRHEATLPSDHGKVLNGTIDHLAVNYIRINAGSAVGGVECVLEGDGLHGQIAEYRCDGTRGQCADLLPSGRLLVAGPIPVDHYVVTLSNGSLTDNRVPYGLKLGSL